MPAKDVKADVKRNKNDAADAEPLYNRSLAIKMRSGAITSVWLYPRSRRMKSSTLAAGEYALQS